MNYPVLDMKATGARIRELRKANNLKVEEVARYMGFESEQAVYKWQRGESLPTVDNLYALSRLFRTTIDNILIGSREEDESPSLPFFGEGRDDRSIERCRKLTDLRGLVRGRAETSGSSDLHLHDAA